MTAAAPWSVKGIDPKAREVAKELARRSGMTLGEWLNRIILEDDMPEEVTSEEHFNPRPVRAAAEAPKSYMSSSPIIAKPSLAGPGLGAPDDLGRIAFALDRLTDRIEASETRTGLAISGVEHSVRHAMARIETAEREHMAVATRFDAAAEQLAAEQARAADRLRLVESEMLGRPSAEAVQALEDSVTRVAGEIFEVEARNRAALAALEGRLAEAEMTGPRSIEAVRALEARLATAEADAARALEARLARLAGEVGESEARAGAALSGLEERLARAEGEGRAAIVEEVVSHMAQRLADAEARTGEALAGLKDSLAALDQRMYAADGSVRGDLDHRLEALAGQLARRVEDARSEVAERLAAADPAQMEARLGQMAQEMAAAEQRSARAIEAMGREVLTMADALSRRVQSAEQRSAEAIEQVGGEIARIAGAVENRLGRTDQLHAEALERLGGEIGRITERLTDRIIQSERRAAQAIDDVGEQVAKVTERIEQRHERAAGDLAERIRQSEERTARLLRDAQARLAADPDAAAGEPSVQADAERAEAAPMVFGAELFSRAEPVAPPALDPGNPAFDEEDFAHVDAFAPLGEFAPISEREDDDRLDLDAPPPRGEAAALSTREVIEQARAAARAAAAAPRPKTVQAGERRARPARGGGLFGALKPARPASTWQTALMVAGGAAFLSVGAAGVVLMEGPGASHATHEALAPEPPTPRAALALAPDAVAAPPPAAIETPPAPVPAVPTAEAADYAKIVTAVEKKQPGALSRLKALADGGHAPAQLFLARLYETGQAGVVQNLAEARRWTARAAEAGEPTAMHNLALYDFRGEGGAQDTAAAAQWFKKAAERGVVDSQYNLGLLYQSGSGVPRDLAQAYKWFSIAANGGDAEARANALDLQARLSAAQLAQADAQAKAFEPAPGAPAQALAPSLVAAQKVLGRLGYYKGRADGTNSRELQLAVSAYQRDQGLAATGSLDPATVSRLSVFSR